MTEDAGNTSPGGQADWRILWQLSTQDIAFFKSQQWLVTNYGALVYAAILGIFALINDNASQFERWLLAAFAVAGGVACAYVINSLQTAIETARAHVSAAESLVSPDVKKKLDEIARQYATKRRPDVQRLLYAVLLVGGLVTSWLVVCRL